jgi:transcriptional regulator with XRE-family HTH domain
MTNDTHKMSAEIEPPYKEFALKLTELRQRVGISQQAELGGLVKASQQSVSRWEAGTSRPRANQIPLLARMLRVSADELLIAAGYAPKETVASFDKPFPVDGLSPESFERFGQSLLEELFPDAAVHAVGGQGHTQEGADIDVTFDDGTRYSFQCKRVDQFGPRDVEKAVAAHTIQAAKKIILLSRIASPRTRDAVRGLPGWDIWDKEDLSRKVRSLLREQQVRLVTTFFPERRFALLGDTAEGRWQTSEEFFAPYMAGRGAFTHDWPLVGRTAELRQLSAGLEDPRIKVILLAGPGGGGKSRIIKEAIGEYQAAHKELIVRFLSPTQDATGESLDELGKGDKLLIVDDAHDRGDLPLLLQYIATPENNARLVLSLRSYGRDYIKSQAANFALAGGSIAEVSLPPLTLPQATELARQALERFSGPVAEAETIARFTRDCSLATVIGAQVVATDRRHFEMVKNEDVFRSTLLGKFQDIIAGRVGSKSETELVRAVIRVLALIQPFYPEDQTILQVIADAEDAVEPHDVSRFIRALTEAGVLFRRGGRYRLSPDLLADHIIEEACVGPGGVSTGYAEKVFAAAGERHIGHVLLNLGKLDWRLANGQPRNSRLLDGIWSQLAPSTDYGDPHIKAVTAVAYFQPDRALSFAEKLIRSGQYLRDLPELIKYAAYTYEYTTRACECLWELGKKDSTNIDQNSNHATRILADLCAVHPNKPIQFNEVVIDFGLSLLKREDAWKHRYSPFDILKGILRPEGDITESDGRQIILKKFGVNLEAVTALRTKVADSVIDTLSHPNIRAAALATQALREALRYPMDVSMEARQKWTDHFCETLTKVQYAIANKAIDPLVLVEIADAISWHANYGLEKTGAIARGILDTLPESLEFRTLLTFVRGPASIFERYSDHQNHQEKLERHLARLATDLLRVYPDGKQLRRFFAEQIAHIRAFSSKTSFSPHQLYERLIADSLPLARATVDDALADANSPTVIFAAVALVEIMKRDRAEGVTYIERFIKAGSADLRAAVAVAFGALWPHEPPFSPEELSIFRGLFRDNNAEVVRRAVSAARRVAGGDSRLAIEFFKIVDVGMSEQLADDVFMNFAAESGGLLAALNDEDVDVFLCRLFSLPELDGWWIETFLAAVSEKYAIRLAKFFMDRVDHAAATENWDYRPCNYGPYGNVPLRFRSSPDFDFVLRQVSEWMKTRDGLLFRERSAQLFDTMFKPFDELVVASLQRWSETATEADIKAIAKILGEAPADFVFRHRDFVVRFAERARQFGKGRLDETIGNLFRSAIGGVRSGTPGEPTPHDLAMKAEAEKAAAEIPRFSPAFPLYESIAKHAVWSIDMSIRDGEAFEE